MSYQFSPPASPSKALFPADELGRLRAEISRLEAREAELRRRILSDPLACAGAEYHVTVSIREQRVLLRDRLPPEILHDDEMWEVRRSRHVRVVRAAERPAVMADPAARPVATGEDDDPFEVIEPF